MDSESVGCVVRVSMDDLARMLQLPDGFVVEDVAPPGIRTKKDITVRIGAPGPAVPCVLYEQRSEVLLPYVSLQSIHEACGKGHSGESKIWGHVEHIFGDRTSCSLLKDLIPGTACSIHYHEKRINKFVVVSATIKVTEYTGRIRDMGKLMIADHTPTDYLGLATRSVKLTPGDVYDVSPGVVHSFEVIESGDVVEVYWCADGSKPEHDDIHRLVEGRVL